MCNQQLYAEGAQIAQMLQVLDAPEADEREYAAHSKNEDPKRVVSQYSRVIFVANNLWEKSSDPVAVNHAGAELDEENHNLHDPHVLLAECV